nr:sortilin-related receptor-like isoform X7 [Dermacentor andersoni]
MSCVRPDSVCDGEPQCPDASDERDCIRLGCQKDMYACSVEGVTRCLKRSLVCDGVADCDDHEDESNCNQTVLNARPGFFDDSPLDLDDKNDVPAVRDMVDRGNSTLSPLRNGTVRTTQPRAGGGFGSLGNSTNETETRPPPPVPVDGKCRPTEFSCLATKTCVPAQWRCDGTADCEDGSDEVNCTRRVCLEPFVSCGDQSSCVLKKKFCDGKFDCNDHSDELGCTRCAPPLIKCATVNRCIDKAAVCNGVNDCEDRSDEQNCRPGKSVLSGRDGKTGHLDDCRSREYSCRSTHECIPMRWLCDGSEDCEDGSDEEMCHDKGNNLPFRSAGSFIPDDKGSLPLHNAGNPIPVQNSPVFIPVNKGPGSGKTGEPLDPVEYEEVDDEKFHEEEAEKVCEPAEFYATCGDGVTCIPKTSVCDGVVDCPDRFDESNCSKGVTPKINALKGLSVPEEDRLKFPDCPADYFRCKTGGKCIMNILVCDDEDDCNDGSDEKNCVKQCPPTHFQCESDKSCIKRLFRCDGDVDCEDASDEKNCPVGGAGGSQ